MNKIYFEGLYDELLVISLRAVIDGVLDTIEVRKNSMNVIIGTENRAQQFFIGRFTDDDLIRERIRFIEDLYAQNRSGV